MSDMIHLRHFRFFSSEKGGVRRYLLVQDAITALAHGHRIYLEGQGDDGRSYGTGCQIKIVVKKIDYNPTTGHYEMAIDHPWWSMAICQKADYPMGTGWQQPVPLTIAISTQEHQLKYGY